ncbi:hypothetical protein NHI66_002265 [Clostridium botulinum]|nr:hypothetical protein [Clostridium botulinum]
MNGVLINELTDKVIEHLKSEGKNCSYAGVSTGIPMIILNDKKYLVRLSTYGSSGSIIPVQHAVLIPA